MSKIIFIDRDGVINVDPIGDYIKRWEDFQFEEGALEALEMLSRAGFSTIVISNQAGVGDGIYPESELKRIDQDMRKVFEKKGIRFEASYYCPHGKKADCECRKPKTGLFKKAARHHAFDPASTYFIGDKITDIEAGKAFGLKTILVRTGHGKENELKLMGLAVQPDLICDSLWHAAQLLCP